MAKKSAVYKDYTINREDNDSITVYKNDELCSNSIEAMKEIAKQCGFTIDEKWNTRQTGNKLIDFLNSQQPTEQNNSKQKGITKEAIVRIDTGVLNRRCFLIPGKRYGRNIFSYKVWDEFDFEVKIGKKVFDYTFGDLLPFGELLWSADETNIRCFKEGWEEIDGDEYDDITLEYVIPLKEGEEFDPKKLAFVESADNIYGDYCIDPFFIFYFHDKKNIEEIYESSGILEDII